MLFYEYILAETPTGYFYHLKLPWKTAKDNCQMVGLSETLQVPSRSRTIWLECYHVKHNHIMKKQYVRHGHQLEDCLKFCESYKSIGLTVNINEQLTAGDCLSVTKNRNNQYFSANTCNSSLRTYCLTDSDKRIIPKDDCQPRHRVSYNEYNNVVPQYEGTFWLADIRRPIIQNVPDVNVSPTYCIAVQIRKDDHQVFSFVRPCTDEYQAICANTDMTSTMSVESPPGLKSKERIDNVLLIALIITAVLAVSVLIVVIVLYRRRISLRSGHQQIPVQNNEVTYAQVNKPTKDRAPVIAGEPIRNNTADDTYDHTEHHRLSQNQIPTESNYDTMQSVGNEELENDYDVTSGTDRPRQIVVDDTAEYSHVEGEVEYQEFKDVST
ncbi:unnamed protein product [Mytilus edulis]|uniref:Uncharacterized protein n=1 Tax=Mytilus edulis TaxID=6550 RepID=A0A8S3S075_MYTED|nr:unnamed protein product [Mytilus edulis]